MNGWLRSTATVPLPAASSSPTPSKRYGSTRINRRVRRMPNDKAWVANAKPHSSPPMNPPPGSLWPRINTRTENTTSSSTRRRAVVWSTSAFMDGPPASRPHAARG